MRHHFIPVFYLRNFTDNEGLFHIYDVVKRSLKENGRKFAPSTHFYEHDLNTVSSGQNQSNFIERKYGKLDSQIGEIVGKIKRGDGMSLTPYEWTYLQYFVNVLYWRNPSNTGMIEYLVAEAKDLSPFGMNLIRKDTGSRCAPDEEKRLMMMPDFLKFQRINLPGATYPEIFKRDINDHAHIITFPEGLPKLVSDNPIIFFHSPNESLHTAPFIFPITPTKILFRTIKPSLQVRAKIRVAIDMLITMQARSYVSSTDAIYPSILIDNFYREFDSLSKLKSYIFENL